MSERKSVRVLITGRVQGVWYRKWAQQTAESLNLSGWVRNREDGAVEALFAGLEDNVDKMIDKCYSGPPHAEVKRVEILAEGEAAQEGFAVLPTV